MDVSLLEDALRRSSSSLNTGHPTRTLHITASEQSLLRDNATPTSMIISAEELSSRPRSNPRSRTPMRFESPLNNDAFRRRAVSPSPVPEEPPRVTIRPLAASPLHERGHMRRHGNLTQREQQPSRSSKQGKPSQRKIRRWNNEHFVDLATEISSSSTRGAATAEVLIKAHRDAHLYRPIYDPKEHCRSEAVVRYVCNISFLLPLQRKETGILIAFSLIPPLQIYEQQ